MLYSFFVFDGMGCKTICAVVPAYNAADTLPGVLSLFVKTFSEASIVVVDDGSSDNLYDAVKRFKLHYVQHKENRGKGAALRSGFQKAFELGADYIFTFDADAQHNPEESPKLLHKLTDDKLDMVIGARTDRQNMPFHRIISNRLTSALISLRLRQNILDSQSGYRLIKAEVLKHITLTTEKFDLETELLIKAHLADFRIGFVAISTIYGNQHSSVKVIDVFRFIKLYMRSFFW